MLASQGEETDELEATTEVQLPAAAASEGFLWTLLGLFTLGALATILAGRRRCSRRTPSPSPAGRRPRARPEPEPAPGESLWIAGPPGNLYVRDGGGGEPDALPVLFLHSLAGNGGQWALQLDHLRRHRRAVALDLRGHGESDPAEDGDYSIAGLAADVAAAADQLGLRRFVLAGHSLGASVAIEYAGRHPERVAGLLLVDPNGDLSRVPRERRSGRSWKRCAPIPWASSSPTSASSSSAATATPPAGCSRTSASPTRTPSLGAPSKAASRYSPCPPWSATRDRSCRSSAT